MTCADDIVTRLQSGTRVDRVADLVGVDRRTVTRIAHEHGLRITRDGTAEPLSKPQEGPAMNTSAHIPQTPPRQDPRGWVKGLLDHPDAGVRAAAKAAMRDLDHLHDRVTAYRVEDSARAEVARLEAELAAAKAKLRGSATPKSPPAVDARLVRAWAAANDVSCPPVGRVPASVVEQYRAAQESAA